MAQNECQQMSKEDFYANIRNLMSTNYNHMANMRRAAEFLNTVDSDTLDNMGVPASGSDEQLRTTLTQLRTAINEFCNFWDGTSTSQSQVLKTAINKLRYI